MTLKNKVVWITGASSGIGEALAHEYSKLGAKLILSSRKEDELNRVKASLHYPENATVLVLDLAHHNEFESKVNKAIKIYNGIDLLINNGGLSQRSQSVDTKLEVDKKLMDVNYIGTVGLTKALLPHFISKKSGSFAVISSVTGLYGVPGRASYAATKHALHGFFDSLRAEVFDLNIQVSICCPGFVSTNVSKNALTGDGIKQGTMDEATAGGIEPNVFAKKFISNMNSKKDLFYIAGGKERFGIFASKYMPWLFKILVRKLKTT